MTEKKIITLNSTAIAIYLECPMKYNYASLQCLSLKGAKREAMDKGELMHHLICRWIELRAERDPKPFNTITLELKEKLANGFNDLDRETVDFIRQRFFAYAMFWEDDMAKPLFVPSKDPNEKSKVAVEIGFSVILHEDENFIFILEGRLDRVAEQQGIQFVLDHKTQSRKHEYHRRRPQFLNYVLGAQLDGLPISKLMVDYIGLQQTISKETFRRDMFHYPPSVIAEWKQYLINRVYMPLAREEQFCKELGSCEGQWGPCSFIDLCEAPSTRAIEQLIELKYERKEPHRSW